MVAVMAKKRDGAAEPAPKKIDKTRKKTTFRVYAETAQKLSELATLRKVAIHDLIDEMFGDLIDAALIEATERRLSQLRPKDE